MTTMLRPQYRTPTRADRRQLLASGVLVLLLTATAFVAGRSVLNDKHRSYLSTDGWPAQGQGAYLLGDCRPAVSPHQQPVPIASLAKVMTAYLVLKHYPLNSGRRFVV